MKLQNGHFSCLQVIELKNDALAKSFLGSNQAVRMSELNLVFYFRFFQ